MPRSPSPRRESDQSYRRDDRERRRSRSRSPDRRRDHRDERDHHRSSRDTRDERNSGRDRYGESSEAAPRRRERSRSRSRSRSPRAKDNHRERERDDRDRDRKASSSRRRSRSRSRSDSGSSSGSEDSRERRHRKKKSRSSDKLDSKGRTKEERRERRQEKKDKKERKARKSKGLMVVEWGKHGIISEPDIYTKDQEFRAWLVGERMINPETLSKPKTKETFKIYMEEYNTGTLPHDKYYDLGKWEATQNAIRMGETVEKDDGSYDARKDMDAVRASHKRAVVETDTFLDRTHLANLRKLQNERVEMEGMRQRGMQPRESMGVRMETREESQMK